MTNGIKLSLWMLVAGASLAVTVSMQNRLAAQSQPAWQLKWADDFNGSANTPPDPAKWRYDLGDGSPRSPGWGNYEKQLYTDSTANVFEDGEGHLVIRARKEGAAYTSGRIKTQDRFEFTYGKVEARIRIPYAQGLWPAFWMLGASYKTVAWPICGEMDIMENFGVRNRDAGVNHGTLHGPGYASSGITGDYRLPVGQTFSGDFHIFSAVWDPDSVEFFVDGNSYLKATPASMPARSSWVFNGSPFFLVLDLAVGGYPAPVGYPDDTVKFPQEMVVDYIRVYQR